MGKVLLQHHGGQNYGLNVIARTEKIINREQKDMQIYIYVHIHMYITYIHTFNSLYIYFTLQLKLLGW